MFHITPKCSHWDQFFLILFAFKVYNLFALFMEYLEENIIQITDIFVHNLYVIFNLD